MKYTKGPWVFNPESRQYADTRTPESYSGVIHEDKPLGMALAVIINDCVDGKANAHLISAAPDMYEAAKEIMNRFNGGVRFPLQSSCDKMNQALAKAEGRE
ncbi:hypothetical protein LCGC14_2004980 [marine sediment metagenome]|uniref:Uncharacterized protein n=1 Tax=marine sediment metagenome TaxID=412755 RepID=A0A0F9FPN9_9ZZZZ